MGLGPDDVHEVVFARSAPGTRGYHMGEVDAFLDLVESTLRGGTAITAAQVQQVTFSRAPLLSRGYREEEVDAFLDLVTAELVEREAQAGGSTPGNGLSGIPRPVGPDDVHNVTFSRPRDDHDCYQEDEVDAFLDRVEATLRGTDELTADEVRHVLFNRPADNRRGYDADEVDQFLDLVEATLRFHQHNGYHAATHGW
ncbi:DivIVA domain-containing protein [Goodfellowiella coeruleoviolacea]|uniref:Cell wall synthesis protein Wag31 n=1 Tax=Goodfellowiella coeruleoviolacea TaxID=334858 RepID=A0AAE3GID3_9PSEU|nr:DivIVA domain-containing protein [Goodfellowiella coeruleoviolacea]MCP2168752.1 DivIVA domain-containing protein [Goodfellowiella coeruleoviolacea]